MRGRRGSVLGVAMAAVLFVAHLAAQVYTPVLTYAVSGTTVTLSWTPVTGATSYEVVVAGIAAPIAVGNVLTTTGVVAPGFYDVQVRGRAGTLVGPLSNLVTVPVAVQTPAPTNLAGILSGNGVLLTWDVPSTRGLSSLAVQLLNAQGGVVGSGPVPVGTYAAVPSVPSGTYRIRVIGDGPAGPSVPSNAVSFAVPGCAVAAPIPLAVDTSALVSMQWPAVPGASAYRLDVSTTPGGAVVGSLPMAPGQTSLSTSAPAGTYYVTLYASLACGAVASSTTRTVTVVQQNPPVNWTKEEWRVWFFNLVTARRLPNATLSAMQALRPDLLSVGADWQNGWRGDLRARIYLPVPNCPSPSLSTAPACSYSRPVDVGEAGTGAWTWVPRF